MPLTSTAKRREQMPRTVAELEDLIRANRVKLGKLEDELYKAQCDAANIHAGDIVTQDGEEYLVVRPKEFWANKPWLEVRAKRKDGKWSEKSRTLYREWEKKA
jgi:hypothetical protein